MLQAKAPANRVQSSIIWCNFICSLTLYSMGYFKSWHIFLFLDNIEKIKKNLSSVLNTFENIMENGAFAPNSKCFIFHNIFKHMIFQRRQRALSSWSKVSRYDMSAKFPRGLRGVGSYSACIQNTVWWFYWLWWAGTMIGKGCARMTWIRVSFE